MPSWPFAKVPRDHRESDDAFRRRRRVVAGVGVAGAGLLGASLSTRPNSPQFFALTLSVAATWVAGGVCSGPLHAGWVRTSGDTYRRPVVTPILLGGAAFGAFYAAALIAQRIPIFDRALKSILRYADGDARRFVLLTTLANGVAEEVFFRGALFAAVGEQHPVSRSTGAYMLATTATRNPALVLASGVMGVVFALQRRASGGIQAPILTHVTWSTLMLRYLPPLFSGDGQRLQQDRHRTV